MEESKTNTNTLTIHKISSVHENSNNNFQGYTDYGSKVYLSQVE